jgi:hypothetical protein
VKAENKMIMMFFYNVPLTRQTNGASTVSILENKIICSIQCEELSLFSDINLAGQETKLITNDNKLLYSISKETS